MDLLKISKRLFCLFACFSFVRAKKTWVLLHIFTDKIMLIFVGLIVEFSVRTWARYLRCDYLKMQC